MARPITINIPHDVGKDEARRRITTGFDRLRQQMTGNLDGIFAFQEHWEEDRLHFEGTAMGQKITGRFDVKPESVQIQLDLPEILARMAEKVRDKLQAEGRKLLER